MIILSTFVYAQSEYASFVAGADGVVSLGIDCGGVLLAPVSSVVPAVGS